jgi:hypothetical protein
MRRVSFYCHVGPQHLHLIRRRQQLRRLIRHHRTRVRTATVLLHTFVTWPYISDTRYSIRKRSPFDLLYHSLLRGMTSWSLWLNSRHTHTHDLCTVQLKSNTGILTLFILPSSWCDVIGHKGVTAWYMGHGYGWIEPQPVVRVPRMARDVLG